MLTAVSGATGSLPHVRIGIQDPAGWVFYASVHRPSRLIVFVHGFYGGAVDTWRDFPDAQDPWWEASDLLFVGYDSFRDNIVGAASRLRRRLPDFYPHLPDRYLMAGSARVRSSSEDPYGELCVVGHSLGGVLLRRALCDAARHWETARETDEHAERPPILAADLRLFSPASAGFQASGWLGLLRASPAWAVVRLHLSRSSAFNDLQQDSIILRETRSRTEALVGADRDRFSALRADVLWANPDEVVVTECYTTDRSEDCIDGQNHQSVCKPNWGYLEPWQFVATGAIA
jgi:alpha-beta hydrolase superfamily lysophospholipase